MRSVYYIIPTTGIGGAEKRFIELCCYLMQHEPLFDFHLIISEQLYGATQQDTELRRQLQPYGNKLIRYDIDMNRSIVESQKELYRFIGLHTTANDILHFILSFPTYVFPVKHTRTVYSLTESSLKNVNIKGRILYLLNILRANYVDILDPAVCRQAKNWFFFKKDRIFCTPGSFVDTAVFKPAAMDQKDNTFVFLGRFFYVKQVMELLQALPEVCSKLAAAGISNYRFLFLGYAQLEEKMLSMIKLPEYRQLPIEIKRTNDPAPILAKSKIFFSLQLRNNYPSKSLLEAMAAGNIPLVTDVGTTRKIAAPEFSYYVPEHFSAHNIAAGIIAILSLSDAELQLKMGAARRFVESNFTIDASANYYAGIYKKFL